MKPLHYSILLLALLTFGCDQDQKISESHEISPYIFGQNLWLTGGAEGRTGNFQENLWPEVREVGVKLVRIGGHRYDVNLPGMDTLERWVRAIKEIGAEPLFQIPRYEAMEKSSELVKYFNIE